MNKDLNNLIRVLAHQLKSPINSIQSLLKTVSQGFTGNINEQALVFIEKAIKRSDEAKELITDLINFQFHSQSDLNKQERIELQNLLHLLQGKLANMASEKNIALNFILPEKNEIIIKGNYNGMESALQNLMENALKYSPSNSKVDVKILILENEKKCKIQISDTGYGIKQTELENIFDPFFRSVQHKAQISGTGLGLAITKRIIDNHKGNISVQSKENQGTTFTIILPYSELVPQKTIKIKRKQIVIIGGVTAGPKTAARIRRLEENCDIIIIEQRDFLSYAGCGLPFYISGKVFSPKALMSTADNTIRDINFFAAIHNIKVYNKTRALSIDRKQKTLSVLDLTENKKNTIVYDTLVLATGAKTHIPPIPGIENDGIYTLHSIEDAEKIKLHLREISTKDICIIGGGLIGISIAESFVSTGAHVTIIEKKSSVLSSFMDEDFSEKIQNKLNKKGIKVITRTLITSISKEESHLTINTNTRKYQTDIIILTTGVIPNSDLGKNADLKTGASNGIWVNEYLQTSDPDIYAIGDCAESVNILTGNLEYWPLGSISTKMGRIAADNICGFKTKFHGSIYTVMFKIFDVNVARTGLTTEIAQKNNFKTESIVVSGLDRAHYAENSEFVVIKIIADIKTRTIVGAQGFGRGDIISKISILSTAITKRMTLNEIFNLDLGYAPSFNSPIDIAQTACLVLTNKMDGLIKTISIAELKKHSDEYKLIDVSPISDYNFFSIAKSINIPLENIRAEKIPFEKNEKIILYSKTGSGAYEAYRFLKTQGFEFIRILEGGFIFWSE